MINNCDRDELMKITTGNVVDEYDMLVINISNQTSKYTENMSTLIDKTVHLYSPQLRSMVITECK